jgi:hypothetical protein
MTDERTQDRDPRFDPDRTADDKGKEPRGDRPATDKDDSPWTREGANAPDAADIADPDEQL